VPAKNVDLINRQLHTMDQTHPNHLPASTPAKNSRWPPYWGTASCCVSWRWSSPPPRRKSTRVHAPSREVMARLQRGSVPAAAEPTGWLCGWIQRAEWLPDWRKEEQQGSNRLFIPW